MKITIYTKFAINLTKACLMSFGFFAFLVFTFCFLLPLKPSPEEIMEMIKKESCTIRVDQHLDKNKIKEEIKEYQVTFYTRKTFNLGTQYLIYNWEHKANKGGISYEKKYLTTDSRCKIDFYQNTP